MSVEEGARIGERGRGGAVEPDVRGLRDRLGRRGRQGVLARSPPLPLGGIRLERRARKPRERVGGRDRGIERGREIEERLGRGRRDRRDRDRLGQGVLARSSSFALGGLGDRLGNVERGFGLGRLEQRGAGLRTGEPGGSRSGGVGDERDFQIATKDLATDDFEDMAILDVEPIGHKRGVDDRGQRVAVKDEADVASEPRLVALFANAIP